MKERSKFVDLALTGAALTTLWVGAHACGSGEDRDKVTPQGLPTASRSADAMPSKTALVDPTATETQADQTTSVAGETAVPPLTPEPTKAPELLPDAFHEMRKIKVGETYQNWWEILSTDEKNIIVTFPPVTAEGPKMWEVGFASQVVYVVDQKTGTQTLVTSESQLLDEIFPVDPSNPDSNIDAAERISPDSGIKLWAAKTAADPTIVNNFSGEAAQVIGIQTPDSPTLIQFTVARRQILEGCTEPVLTPVEVSQYTSYTSESAQRESAEFTPTYPVAQGSRDIIGDAPTVCARRFEQ